MGAYTEIFVNADLVADTPKNVIDTLNSICERDLQYITDNNLPKKWTVLFCNGSYYTPNTSIASLSCDDGDYSIFGKGDIKDNGEIDLFFEFIAPWCDGNFLGYSRIEHDDKPIIKYRDEIIKSMEIK